MTAAITMSMGVVLTKPAHAAEVSCAQSWEAAPLIVQGKRANDAYISQWFPSGRHPSAGACRAVLIRGNIEEGDYLKFVYILRQNHPFVGAVALVSSGGLVEEALKIGTIVRQYLLETWAPATSQVDGYGLLLHPYPPLSQGTICEGPACHCASACFLIYAAGASRHGGALGVHRPTIQSTSFANLQPERASTLYRGLLADIASYLSHMEVPQKYIELMSDTASTDIKWLSVEEAQAMSEPRSISEWLAASCGAVTAQETQQTEKLLNLKQQRESNGKMLSDQDEALLWANLAKWERISECQEEKKARFRDAMALPEATAVVPQKAPEAAGPPLCSPELLRLAKENSALV